MKRVITSLLVAGLVLVPVQRSRSDEQPKSALLICGLVVLGVGAVVIWQLYKVCKRLPPVNGTEIPPATNAPPAYTQAQIATAVTSPTAGLATLSDDGARVLDISSLGYVDGNTGTYFIGRLDCQIQTSDNAADWVCAYRVSAWFGPAGSLYLFSDAAGNPVSTNYCRGGMGQIPLSLGTGREPARFFRVAGP